MKDSKQVRSEYQSFVESYSSIAAKGAEEAKEAEMKKKPSKKGEEECTCEKESVLMRKTGAFTELAERYQMSVKQFARFVENNQGLFDIETRKKAVLANKFSGFKESVEWDQFFGDLELVEVQEGMGVVTGTAKAINAVMKRRDQTPAQEKKAVGDLTRAMDVVAKPVKSFLSVGDKKNQEMMNKRRPTAAQAQRMEEVEVEAEDLHEIQTKETAAGTKYKVRVKEKESGSSYIRYATREKIAQLRADPKIASVEMTDEGEAPEDKGEKKAQEKGGGLAVKAKKMKEKKEREAAAKSAGKVKRSVTTEGMDPVGKEDADIDNDGDTDKSDEYLHKRRKAIGKAIKGRKGVKKESFSNWREDLKEIVDPQDQKKIKGGKVNNKVVINPPMGEGFDPQKIAEGLGAELVDCQEVEESVGGSVKMKPGSGLGGGVPSYPKGQEPKKTGAQLPKLQKAGYEPEGDQLDELAPLVAGGLALGAAALGGAAIHRARQASKSGVDAAKKGEKIKPGTGIGQASYGLQRYADSRRKAMELLKQETEVEGDLVDEKLNMKKEKMGDVIKDFYKSDAPQFKGKSKEKRRQMAIAAKLTAERGGKKLGEQLTPEQEGRRRELSKMINRAGTPKGMPLDSPQLKNMQGEYVKLNKLKGV